MSSFEPWRRAARRLKKARIGAQIGAMTRATTWKEPVMSRRNAERIKVTRNPAVATLIWLALIVPAAPAFAQDPVLPRIEFDAAIQQALAKNPSVANAATSITRAEALLQQARTVYRPTVSAGVTNTTLDRERGFNGQVSQPQNQVTFALNGSMNVLAPARWAAVNQ